MCKEGTGGRWSRPHPCIDPDDSMHVFPMFTRPWLVPGFAGRERVHRDRLPR
jgi:hypothetical protein